MMNRYLKRRACTAIMMGLAVQGSLWAQPPAVGNKAQISASQTPASQTPASQEDEVPQVTADKPMSFWMARKLEYSKSILESLTSGDFETLATDATRMRRLGKIEALVRRKSEDYRDQLRAFDLATLELKRQSARKNAEGAALAFNQLTNSCVACHVMLREGIE